MSATVHAEHAGRSRPRAEVRADIQGLRAVSVLAVVLYHLDGLLPGGFVGVDVFFVVSGHLIIGLLARERAATGRIDLPDFFARRVRRILPALALVSSVTVVAALLVVELGEPLRVVLRTAVAASLSIANVVLYREQDYFAPASERNPLLHTWSLSVEEQFYVLVPVVLAVLSAVAARRRWSMARWRRAAIAALVVGGLASFVASVAFVDLGLVLPGLSAPVSFGFFSPVTRAWEFAAGGLLALVGSGTPARARGVRRLLGIVGAGLVLGSMLLLDGTMDFPGLRALPVVAGTLALLLAGPVAVGAPRPVPAGTSLLGHPALTWIGDRSYGWYLWHWPAIVLTEAVVGDRRSVLALAAFGSLGLAHLTHATVEERFRRDVRYRGTRAVVLAAACVLVPVSASAVVLAIDRSVEPDRPPPFAWSHEWCRAAGAIGSDDVDAWPRERCLRGGDGVGRGPDVLLVGDSHADMLSEGVLAALEGSGRSVGVWYRDARPPIGEGGWAEVVLELVRRERPEVVVLAMRSLDYQQDEQEELELGRADEDVATWTSRPAAPGGPRREQWARAAAASVAELRATGARVVWVHNVPEHPAMATGATAGPSLLRPGGQLLVLTADELDLQRDGLIEAERLALEGLDGVVLLDPAEVLCTPDCANSDGLRTLYRGDDHLNVLGSRALAEVLRRDIDRALAMAP